MSGNNEKTLKQAIEDLLRTYRLDDKMREAKVKTFWEKRLGTLISKNTRELKIRDGILIAFIESPVIRNEILMGKSALIDDINKELGEEWIRDIRIFA
jgi:predicted nucleic acid-binding Zn ribbon protein